MGLSIFYSGRLRRIQHLPDLINEVRDICDHMHWSHDMYFPLPDIPLQGMWLAPPGCDQVWLTFTPEGNLGSPADYFLEKGSFPVPDSESGMIDTITQYAGPDEHMKLIGLLRYLSEKYFAAFHLLDESEYWETGDADRCRQWFEMFGVWMDEMSRELGRLDGQGYQPGHTAYERVADLARHGRLKEWIMLDGLRFSPSRIRPVDDR